MPAYAPCLLDAKAARIRKSLSSEYEKGHGPISEVRSRYTGEDRTYVIFHMYQILAHPPDNLLSLSRILRVALVRPFQLLFTEPIVQLLGLYIAFVYGTLYCGSSSQPLCPTTGIIFDSIPHVNAVDVSTNIQGTTGNFGVELSCLGSGSDLSFRVQCV
jgi:hypothetical protein